MTIRNLFSVPIYEYQFKGALLEMIQQEVMTAGKTVENKLDKPWPEEIKSTYSFSGNNTFIDSVPLLKKQILDRYKDYLKEAGSKDCPDLTFSSSWYNVLEPNGFQYGHIHPNSVISGVYYYQCDELEGSKIVFENHNSATDFLDPFERLWPNHGEVAPRVGKLVMFPSWQRHRVSVNRSQFDRIAIAFNLS